MKPTKDTTMKPDEEPEMHVILDSTVCIPASQFALLRGLRPVHLNYNSTRSCYDYELKDTGVTLRVISGPDMAAMIAVQRLTKES